ncbi:MAG: hypothetical protein M3417_14270 [Actinomycetota bacterium]|nr:hypothetical protein [Actinomycetota bacterium]
MAALVSNVLDLMRTRRSATSCLVCGRPVRDDEHSVRLRREGQVHRDCATYSMRRRREGAARLGHPRSR